MRMEEAHAALATAVNVSTIASGPDSAGGGASRRPEETALTKKPALM